MSGSPYISSEDSSLLRMALSSHSGTACLEIGAGNGGNLVFLSKRFKVVVGTDLVRPTMRDWAGVADFVLADGASGFMPSSFDLVAFNPPYLKEEAEDPTTQGGADLEVPKKFLREALRAVKREGTVVFLLNDSADPREFSALCREAGFEMRKEGSHRVFFEELVVYSARAQAP